MTTQVHSSMRFQNESTPTSARLALASTAQRAAITDQWVTDITRGRAVAEICDLIEAAGPLALWDIAGGLDVPVAAATVVVQSMVSGGCLREDEWGRFGMRWS